MEPDFHGAAHAAFRDLVLMQDFPCLGARAAFNAGSYALNVYDELAGDTSTAKLCRELFEFIQSDSRQHDYATFIAVFRSPEVMNELRFEELLWRQLTMLNRVDHETWDPSVRSEPTDAMFSFSFAGQALYVVGMHLHSSRLARRFHWPTLVFNPHVQFERLRADGKWRRMQETIRQRDEALQGSINPMLSDFGDATEARQYSGRAVEEDWRAPFTAANGGKCPFHH